MEFSADLLEETEQQVDRLRNVFRELADRGGRRGGRRPGGGAAGSRRYAGRPYPARAVAARRQAFDDALADDLNTAAALAEVFGLAREANTAMAAGRLTPTAAPQVRAEMAEMVHVLGLDASPASEEAMPADIVAMAEERQQCRAARDFARADALRAAIAERGYEVRDAPGGFKIVPTR